MITLVSWNVGQKANWVAALSSGVDIALLQEVVPESSPALAELVPGGLDTWTTAGWEHRPWRTAIGRLSDRVQLEPIVSGEISGRDRTALPISRSGTITAARVVRDGDIKLIAASVYSPWERYLGKEKPIWADGSAHRILSDLSPLLWDQRHTPVLVSGDWNILRGYGEHGDQVAKRRYQSVFDRADALGLRFVGPEYPKGRQAPGPPAELPAGSTCVPTFHHNRQTPATATRQLDFVFASESIADRVSVTALNSLAEWGPSDHCQVLIEIDV